MLGGNWWALANQVPSQLLHIIASATPRSSAVRYVPQAMQFRGTPGPSGPRTTARVRTSGDRSRPDPIPGTRPQWPKAPPG